MENPPKKPETEIEQQNNLESECREKFIRNHVRALDITPEQKVFVLTYVREKPGAWRQYNGEDFRVVESSVNEKTWSVSFGIFFDDYEAQRIDVEIPLE